MNNKMHNGIWEKSNGHLLHDMNILVIGYGRIGIAVAKILDAIGANIFVYDPFINQDILPDNITKINLNDGLKLANIITIHSSGEDLILGEKEFDLMKSGVYILNAARGSLIDEYSLEKGLISGNIAGAWLDAYQEEPYKGNLTKYSQVILTPHVGSYTIEGRKKMEIDCTKNLIKGLELLY
jgi:Phosphoglycerate dehydrogenase and related dehydrogenases